MRVCVLGVCLRVCTRIARGGVLASIATVTLLERADEDGQIGRILELVDLLHVFVAPSCVCVCACVRVCVRACVRVCLCVRVFARARE